MASTELSELASVTIECRAIGDGRHTRVLDWRADPIADQTSRPVRATAAARAITDTIAWITTWRHFLSLILIRPRGHGARTARTHTAPPQ